MKSDLVGHFLPTAKNLLTGSERMELKLPDGDRLIGRRVPAIDESRRAGTVRGLALETYHSGKSDDLARAVRWGRKNRGRRQVMIGYSLSGNATCLLAARVVPRLGAESPSEAELESRIEGATPDLCIAVNPPLISKRTLFD